MLQAIQHISSRCGGGKSYHAIKELIHQLSLKPSTDRTYILASKTIELSKQNYEVMQNFISNDHPNFSVSIKIIDSSQGGQVVTRLKQELEDGFTGILLVTHATLALIPAKHLKNARIIFDEVPSNFAGVLRLKHDASNQSHPWKRFLVEKQSPPTKPKGSPKRWVELNPQHSRAEVKAYQLDILDGNTADSDEVANLLDLLLRKQTVYIDQVNENNQVYQIYTAVHYDRLERLVQHISQLVILSAELKDTLFGYLATRLLNLTISSPPINNATVLETKHKRHATIIPFLGKDSWSRYLKGRNASEHLLFKGKPIQYAGSVFELAQEFAEQHLSGKQYLIILNTKDKLTPLEPDSRNQERVRISTHVHGMNHLTGFHHAAFLASNNLNPDEERAYKAFAEENALNEDALIKAIKTERSYETAYQCIARTSVRLDHKTHPHKRERHIIIVPNLHFARYIQARFERTAGGVYFCEINDKYAYQTKKSYEEQQRKEANYEKVKSIMAEYLNPKIKTKLSDLYAKYGITRQTFDRVYEEHRLELFYLGLTKPDKVSPSSLGQLYPEIFT